MKILIALPNLEIGGKQSVTQNNAIALRKLGAEVSFLVFQKKGPKNAFLIQNEIDVIWAHKTKSLVVRASNNISIYDLKVFYRMFKGYLFNLINVSKLDD